MLCLYGLEYCCFSTASNYVVHTMQSLDDTVANQLHCVYSIELLTCRRAYKLHHCFCLLFVNMCVCAYKLHIFCLCSLSPVRAVVLFVRQHLMDSDLKFFLCKLFQFNVLHDYISLTCFPTDTTPPKTILRSSVPTLGEAGFVPAANIYLGLRGEGDSENSQLLSPDSLERFSCSAAQAELGSTTIRER